MNQIYLLFIYCYVTLSSFIYDPVSGETLFSRIFMPVLKKRQ